MICEYLNEKSTKSRASVKALLEAHENYAGSCDRRSRTTTWFCRTSKPRHSPICLDRFLAGHELRKGRPSTERRRLAQRIKGHGRIQRSKAVRRKLVATCDRRNKPDPDKSSMLTSCGWMLLRKTGQIVEEISSRPELTKVVVTCAFSNLEKGAYSVWKRLPYPRSRSGQRHSVESLSVHSCRSRR